MTTVTPPENQFFYIASGWSGLQEIVQNQPFVLGVAGNDTAPGAQIALLRKAGTDAQGQLWRMTADGHIISQLNGCAIAWDDAQSQIVTANVGDSNYPYQSWNVTSDGHITNQSVDGTVLTQIVNADYVSVATLMPPSSEIPLRQAWTLLAPMSAGGTTAPTWVYFQSALQDGDQQNYVFNVYQNSTTPGAGVVVWPIPTSPPTPSNELWQVTPDGRILSAQGNNLVLTLGGPTGEGDGEGNYVTVDVQQIPLPLTQTWDLSTPNMIRSAYSGNYVCPAGATAGPITLVGADPVVAAPGDTDSTSYTWYTVTPSPTLLQQILAQQPVPFEVFEGEQGEAYDYIIQQLGVPLRTEYYNLNAVLDDYSQAITSMKPPDNLREAWPPVTDRLLEEILYANTTRALFNNYTIFQNTLFGTDSAALNKLIDDADLTQDEDTTSVGGTILALLEGIAYTALCALPGVGEAEIGVGGIIGNLMQTATNVALAAPGSDALSPDPFQVTVSELWGQLNDNYQALLAAIGTIETTILQDWGMLQSVNPLATQPDGPWFWPPSMTAELVAAATPGYKTAVMQMLLPAKYSIYLRPSADTAAADVPAYAMWQSQGFDYYIAQTDDQSVFPAQSTLQGDLWDNGVKKADFFQSAAGWGFMTYFPAAFYMACLTFTNLTQNTLRLTTPQEVGNNLQNWGSIGPRQSCVVSLNGKYQFQVTDFNSPQSQVGQFSVVALSELPVMITVDSTGPGYQFTTPTCNGKMPFMAQFAITQTPGA